MTAPFPAIEPSPSTPTGATSETPPPEALWTVRYAITGATETVTTTQLQNVLRADRPVFEVTAVPLAREAAA